MSLILNIPLYIHPPIWPDVTEILKDTTMLLFYFCFCCCCLDFSFLGLALGYYLQLCTLALLRLLKSDRMLVRNLGHSYAMHVPNLLDCCSNHSCETLSNTQELLQVLCSGITPGGVERIICATREWIRPVQYKEQRKLKASTISTTI